MSSEGNKVNDVTSYQSSEPALCANGCGFFGTAATMNLCSKCFRDLRIKDEQAASAKAAVEKLVNSNQKASVEALSAPPDACPALVVGESSTPFDLGGARQSAAEEVKVANRCSTCNKKVGVLGFECRCGNTFCGMHRYPEKHACTYDFKAVGRDAIAKANPVVKADKVERF